MRLVSEHLWFHSEQIEVGVERSLEHVDIK